MKIGLWFLALLLFSTTYAQNQRYTFEDGAFSYRITIYDNIAIGDRAVEITTNSTENLELEAALSIVGYDYTGLEPDGTLHFIRADNDFLLGSEESFAVVTAIDELTTFGGLLGRPFNLELNIQAVEGRKLDITLSNANQFEVFTE